MPNTHHYSSKATSPNCDAQEHCEINGKTESDLKDSIVLLQCKISHDWQARQDTPPQITVLIRKAH